MPQLLNRLNLRSSSRLWIMKPTVSLLRLKVKFRDLNTKLDKLSNNWLLKPPRSLKRLKLKSLREFKKSSLKILRMLRRKQKLRLPLIKPRKLLSLKKSMLKKLNNRPLNNRLNPLSMSWPKLRKRFKNFTKRKSKTTTLLPILMEELPLKLKKLLSLEILSLNLRPSLLSLKLRLLPKLLKSLLSKQRLKLRLLQSLQLLMKRKLKLKKLRKISTSIELSNKKPSMLWRETQRTLLLKKL